MLVRTLPVMPAGFEHVAVTMKNRGELADKLEKSGVKVINLGLESWFNGAGLQRLTSEIKRLDPAIVITYLFHADMIGRLYLQRRLSAPVIPFLRTTYNFSRYWPARLAERLTKSWARHYFANSEAVKQFYVGQLGVKSEKITVIPNGINLEVFARADGNKIIHELKLPEKHLVITCVANLAPNKGHSFLLEAFENLAAKLPAAYLLLVGEGASRTELEEQVKAYQSRNRIIFMGSRKDVPDILAGSDLFVLPTLFEGMSNALMEALAAGVPVITTDIPENRQLIKNGLNGVLVKPAEIKDLEAQMQRLLSDKGLRQQLAKSAQADIERRFALKRVAEQWHQEIKRQEQHG